jgi:hypothetical protein
MGVERDHTYYQELLGAYALDALPDDEREALEAHLKTCDSCIAELAELRLATYALPLSVEERAASSSLRDRIRAAAVADLSTNQEPVRLEPRPPSNNVVSIQTSNAAQGSRRGMRFWLPWAAAAVFLLFGLSMFAWNLSLHQSNNEQVIAFQPAPGVSGASGEMVYLQDQHVIILKPSELPALAAGQVYEVWLIQGNTAIPSGVFTAVGGQFAVAADLSQYGAMAITIEDGPLGNTTPKGEKVVVTPL